MPLSPEDVRELYACGLTFDERAESAASGALSKHAARFTRSLLSILQSEDESGLLMVLRKDGFDEKTFRTGLCELDGFAPQEPTASVHLLTECLDCFELAELSETDNIRSDGPIPFEELLHPFAIQARRRRDAALNGIGGMFSEKVLNDLDQSLLRQLSSACAISLYDVFSIYRNIKRSARLQSSLEYEPDVYRSFVADFQENVWRDFLFAYPVCARLISSIVSQWISNTTLLISRLEEDIDQVQQLIATDVPPGEVIAIESNLSDPHVGGRSVCLLTFSNGSRLIYKPRPVSQEAAWFRFIEWCKDSRWPVSLVAPKVLDRQGYGWVQFVERVEAHSREQALTFFENVGRTLFLVQMLHGTDIHADNIVPHGDCPVLVDLETLFHPETSVHDIPFDANAAETQAMRFIRLSCLAPSILPAWLPIRGNKLIAAGALNPPERHEVGMSRLHSVNSAAMDFGICAIMLEATSIYNHGYLAPDGICDAVMNGYASLAHFAMKNAALLLDAGGPLSFFERVNRRIVFRPTALYELINVRGRHPDAACSGLLWSANFFYLTRYWRSEVGLSVRASERRALARADIPYFCTDWRKGCEILTDGEDAVEWPVEPTQLLVRRQIENMSEFDVERNLDLIKQSFDAFRSKPIPDYQWSNWQESAGESSALTASQAINLSNELACTLERSAFFGADGTAWIGVVPFKEERLSSVEVLGFDLYSGNLGIALFLAALARVSEEAKWRRLCLQAVGPFRRMLRNQDKMRESISLRGIGIASGMASAVYGLLRIGVILDEGALLEDCRSTSESITERMITADDKLDIVAGTAGALVGFLAAYEHFRDDALLQKSVQCGEHLLTRQIQEVGGWKTCDQSPLTGFSHGAAGIALALARLYQITGDKRFLVASQRGIDFERGHFLESEGNWRDLRVIPCAIEGRAPCQWCHGASGIGLARVGCLQVENDRKLANEIEVALSATMNVPMIPFDHVCCGNFGRLETIFRIGQQLSSNQIIEIARTRSSQLLEQRRRDGGFSWASGKNEMNPGFFSGISGIGYHLLRFTHPSTLPCILLWE